MRNSAFRKLAVVLIAINAALIWLWRRSRRQPIPATPFASAPLATTQPVEPAPVETATTQPTSTPPATPAPRWLLPALAIVLLLAFLGQSVFEQGKPYPFNAISPFIPRGLALYLLAVVAFTVAANRVEQLRSSHHTATSLDSPDEADLTTEVMTVSAAPAHQPRRLIALALAGALIFVLLDLLRANPPLPDYTLPFILWLGAIGLYLWATVPPQSRARQDDATWWKNHWRVAALLMIIVLVAFALRVWHIDSIPPTLAGDEGTFGLESIKAINGDIRNRNPFTTGWLSVPALTFHFNSITIRIFGQTIFALRLPWALVGTITVLIVYRLVKRLAGRTLGLTTAALLATYHFHIHYSRLGINNAADPLLMALVLLLVYRAVDRRSLLDWALCGVVVGMAQYFYFGARFAAIVVVVMIVYFLARDGLRFWREQRRGLAIMLGAAIVTAAPMIQYALRFPDDYNARVNQIGIIQSGWLEREQAIRNQGALPILLDQVQRSVLAFNAYPDRTGWYGSPQPLFDFLTGMLFLLGLGYATLRPGERRLFPMVAWWWGATILGGALTESPPSSQRLITLAPPAIFFVALALVKLSQVVQRAWGAWPARFLTPYLTAAVLGLGLVSVNYYFEIFTPLRVFGGFNAVVATELAAYARDKLGPEWRIYFFGPPRMYILFGTIPYLAPQVEGVDVRELLVTPPDPGLAPPDKNAAFVFLPERRAELDLVRQTFPDGVLEEIPSFWEKDPFPLFSVYRVMRRGLP